MMKWLIVICCCLLFGCKQIVRSVEETFHPVAEAPSKKNVDSVTTITHSSSSSSEWSVDTSHFAITIETDAPLPASVKQQIEKTINPNLSIKIKTRSSSSSPRHVNFLTSESHYLKAEETLRKLPQYAGKEIFIYSSIHFYNDGSIRTMLQHPENPEYIDNYVYINGAWSEPKPQQVSIKDRIASRLVSLNKIHFVNAARVASIYNEKAAEVEGAKPATSVYISIWDNRIRWFPGTINGTREKWSIDFDTDGGLKRFERE